MVSHSHSILVVDDDPNVRELLQTVLEPQGYKITLAEDGARAGKLLRIHPFDLVITDVLMPDRDGLELIAEVRVRFPTTRIVAMTGGGQIAQEQYLMIAKNLGANALVHKPFNPKQMLAAIHEVLGDKAPGGTSVSGGPAGR